MRRMDGRTDCIVVVLSRSWIGWRWRTKYGVVRLSPASAAAFCLTQAVLGTQWYSW